MESQKTGTIKNIKNLAEKSMDKSKAKRNKWVLPKDTELKYNEIQPPYNGNDSLFPEFINLENNWDCMSNTSFKRNIHFAWNVVLQLKPKRTIGQP